MGVGVGVGVCACMWVCAHACVLWSLEVMCMGVGVGVGVCVCMWVGVHVCPLVTQAYLVRKVLNPCTTRLVPAPVFLLIAQC